MWGSGGGNNCSQEFLVCCNRKKEENDHRSKYLTKWGNSYLMAALSFLKNKPKPLVEGEEEDAGTQRLGRNGGERITIVLTASTPPTPLLNVLLRDSPFPVLSVV